MKVQVTNLLTQEKEIFVNNYSLSHNIISLIIINDNKTGQILNADLRDKIAQQYPIKESISTLTGKAFAYCENKDLHAKFL